MPESLQSLKAFLKAEADKFRLQRRNKIQKNIYERFRYRCHHVAYCLLRGRTWEQIECSRLQNPPDPSHYWERTLRKQVAEIMQKVSEGIYGT